MNKVITINLNGNAFQLEEPGYEALRAYLDRAAAKLADNPDKEEIIADFEQAIADKCSQYVSANKNVVTTNEIDAILSQMGPVHDTSDAADATASQPAADMPKRLFRIRKGAMIEGVCNGFAVYFNLDPAIVRILFVILTILTGGAWVIAYIIMVFVIPEAKTPADIAKAQGKEFNAEAVMQNAKERYEYWMKFGKEHAGNWHHHGPKGQTRGETTEVETQNRNKAMPTLEQLNQWHESHNQNRVLRAIAGIFGAIGVLALLGLGVLWVVGLVHILNNGSLLGYFQGANTALVALLYSCVFYLLFLPLQGLVAQAIHYAKNYASAASFWATFMTTVMWLAALGGIIAIAMYSPQIEEGLRQIKHDVDYSGTIGR